MSKKKYKNLHIHTQRASRACEHMLVNICSIAKLKTQTNRNVKSRVISSELMLLCLKNVIFSGASENENNM